MKFDNISVNLNIVKDMKKDEFSKMYKNIKNVDVDGLWKKVQKAIKELK